MIEHLSYTTAKKPDNWLINQDSTQGFFAPQKQSNEFLVLDNLQHQTFQVADKGSLDRELFDATAQAKIWTSQVAMRLSREARTRFFRQLDRLHDVDEWLEGDSPVNLASYRSFIRAILGLHISSKPSLALAPTGELMAIWDSSGDQLSIEFLPNDLCRWMVRIRVDGQVERTAGDCQVSRLSTLLEPFNPERWLNGS